MRAHGTEISFFLSLPPLSFNALAYQKFAALELGYHCRKCTNFERLQFDIERKIRPWSTVPGWRDIGPDYRRRSSWRWPHSMAYRCRCSLSPLLIVASRFYNIFPPFLRPCVIHPQRKYFNQPVLSNLIFLFFYRPHSAETKIPCSFFNIYCITWYFFWTGLAMLIHGAWVMFLQLPLGRNWLRKYRFSKTITIQRY